MARAQQTAEILFPDAGKRLVIDDLRENHFGEFEGRTIQELKTDPHFQLWMDPAKNTSPWGRIGPGFPPAVRPHLLRMFEYMMKAGIDKAACVTHGGVIMSMLAQQALPRRRPEDWMADPGCGYQLQTSAAMWMRDGLAEAVRILPFGYMDPPEEDEQAEEE